MVHYVPVETPVNTVNLMMHYVPVETPVNTVNLMVHYVPVETPVLCKYSKSDGALCSC